MIAAPHTADEPDRLADLHALRLLDSPAEGRFDRVVALARRAFDVPIAYIALIDDKRQWFKSRCGMDLTESARDTSFCAHTILQREPLIVEDAALDARFADSPLVTGEPGIRFYAGYPLRGPAGRNVGTLCLADRSPRPRDTVDLGLFETLAELAEEQLGMTGVIREQRELLAMKDELLGTQARLRAELEDAAGYVRSLLPDPIGDPPVRTRWIFDSSSTLGGDIFGYHWLPRDRVDIGRGGAGPDDRGAFAFYLVDVMGHGVGAALLASAVQAALRQHTLPGVDFADPASVIHGLNRAFPIERHAGRFFSAVYGVWDPARRTLRYANAGHPAPLVLQRERRHLLAATGPVAGLTDDLAITGGAMQIRLDDPASLFIFSDGAYEVPVDERGEHLGLEGMHDLIAAHHGRTPCAEMLGTIRDRIVDLAATHGDGIKDDLSLLQLELS